MAGSDQSVNLGGMLSNIGSTIGKGYEIAGKSAGEAMGGLIANAVKPEVDMNDAESIRQFAQWVERNGNPEMAADLRMKAEEVATKTRTGKTLSKSLENDQTIEQMAVQGDEEAYKYHLNQQRELIQELALTDPAQASALSASLRQQGGADRLAAVREQGVENKAMGLVKYDQMLSEMDDDDPRKANLQIARDNLAGDKNVELRAAEKRVEFAEANIKQTEAEFLQAAPTIQQEIAAAQGDPEKLESVIAKYPQHSAKVEQLVSSSAATHNLLADMKADNTPPDYDFIESHIDGSNLTEGQKTAMNRSLEAVINNKAITPRAAKEQAAVVLDNVGRLEMAAEQVRIQEDADRRVRDEVYVEEMARLVSAGPSDQEALAYVKAAEDVGEEVTVEEAKGILAEEQYDFQTRELIRLGKKEPMQVDKEDAATIKAALDDGGSPLDLVEYMIRQGYDEESVKKVMRDHLSGRDFKAGDVDASVDAVVARINESDAEYKTQVNTNYDARKRQRGTDGRVRPEAPVPGSSAKQKLLANPYQGVELSPFENKLAAARKKQNEGNGFQYNSNILELLQGDLDNRRR